MMDESIRIAILNTTDNLCTFMDNSAPEALHFYNDEIHEYLKGDAYTFKFSCSAKHEDAQYIVEGNKLSFRDAKRQKDYYLNIMHVEKDEYEIRAECYGLLFELLNEDVAPYSAGSAMTFEQYYHLIDQEGSTVLGINEVSDKSIKHEWTGTETMLARLYSLATVFDAEIEFAVELNDDYSLKRIVTNVYKEHSDSNQGIGDYRSDITLRYGIDVTGITKTADITNLYTAIRPYGKDNLQITNLVKTEYDENGNVEFQTTAGDNSIRAVQARDRFPSNLTKTYDGYIMREWDYNTDNVEMLYGQALAELKKISEPEVTYEVEGYIDAGIGDVVNIVDEEYNPPLYLQARITEQARSFTDPTINTTTFSNIVELESEVDQDLLKQVEELKKQADQASEDAKKAVEECTTNLRIESSRGTVFKNDSISTVLSVAIYRGSQRITDSETLKSVIPGAYLQWKWLRLDDESYGIISADDERFGDNGFTFTLSPDDVDTKVTFLCELIV